MEKGCEKFVVQEGWRAVGGVMVVGRLICLAGLEALNVVLGSVRGSLDGWIEVCACHCVIPGRNESYRVGGFGSLFLRRGLLKVDRGGAARKLYCRPDRRDNAQPGQTGKLN